MLFIGICRVQVTRSCTGLGEWESLMVFPAVCLMPLFCLPVWVVHFGIGGDALAFHFPCVTQSPGSDDLRPTLFPKVAFRSLPLPSFPTTVCPVVGRTGRQCGDADI